MPRKSNPSRPASHAPAVEQWRAVLAAYTDTRGGFRCPACDAPIRILATPEPVLIGCDDVADLARLIASVVA